MKVSPLRKMLSKWVGWGPPYFTVASSNNTSFAVIQQAFQGHPPTDVAELKHDNKRSKTNVSPKSTQELVPSIVNFKAFSIEHQNNKDVAFAAS